MNDQSIELQHCGQPMRYEATTDGATFDGQKLTGTFYCERCSAMRPTYAAAPVDSGTEVAKLHVFEPYDSDEDDSNYCRICDMYQFDKRFHVEAKAELENAAQNDSVKAGREHRGLPRSESQATSELNAAPRQNYWTERDASNDIELPRCIHGEPRNVFCGKCEA